jgi:hypothetical protein
MSVRLPPPDLEMTAAAWSSLTIVALRHTDERPSAAALT